MFLDPEWHAIIEARDFDERRSTRWDLLDSIITFATEIRDNIPEGDRPRMRLWKYRVIPTCGITWVDEDLMIVTHYASHEDNLNSPGYTLRNYRIPSLFRRMRLLGSEESLYDVYRRNFQYVYGRKWPITADDIETYKRMKEEIDATGDVVSEEDRRDLGAGTEGE